MRSRDDSVPRWAGVRRALERGVCGVGGRLDTPPADLAGAVVAVDRAHGERVARRLERFAAVPDGAEVWTRDEDGRTHRGLLTGPWRYDTSRAAHDADLVHVRPCTWTPVADADVPEPVHATFERGGRNFQRIRALGPSAG